MNETRRSFLRSAGVLATACSLPHSGLLASGLTLLEPLQATGVGRTPVIRGKKLVLVFLRGGVDGLNLIVPHGEAGYYARRPGIAIRRPGEDGGALDLDGFFGLHPAAEALLPWFKAGTATAIHAVGYPANTRSHFEEQDTWETAVIGNTIHSEGWVNRHLGCTEGVGPVRAVAVGDSLPRILRGKEQALAIRGLSDLSLGEGGGNLPATVAALEKAYRAHPMGAHERREGASELLAQTGRSTLSALQELRSVANAPYRTDVAYPQQELAVRFREVARLFKAEIGLEVAEIDFGGWDTHQNQGGSQGPFANRLRQLSQALASFLEDLGDGIEDVLVLAFSEFGRTAAQNGTGGTDHGWGNCLLALGGPVARASDAGPRFVLGEWPGLARDQLNEERDLRHTTDFRDVFAEVVKEHLGNPQLEKVLPQHSVRPVGLI